MDSNRNFYPPFQIGLKGVKILGLVQREDSLRIKARKDSRGESCPQCGKVSTNLHEMRRHLVIDKPIYKLRVELEVEKRRWKCGSKSCPTTIFTEEMDGLAKKGRFTEAFRDFAHKLTKKMSYIETQRHLKSEFNTPVSIATIFYDSLKRTIAERQEKPFKIDESEI